MKTTDATLGLLFTRGMSLVAWDRIGSLEREILPYQELAKSFKQIYFFTYGGEADLKYVGIMPPNIKIIPKPFLIPSSLYVFLMPILRAKYFKKCDILKTNQMDGSWAGVIAKKLFGLKLVVRSGYEWLSFLKGNNAPGWKKAIARTIESLSYKNADEITITSEEDKQFIKQTFKIFDDKIEIIRNYIDTERFQPGDIREKIPNNIIYVGRLEKDKNLDLLLNALGGVDCKIALIGEGSQKENLKSLAKDLKIKAEFLGKIAQSKLPKELQQREIFILPSKSEGNPKALLEAMSCGLAVVGTDAKGIREVIRDDETGLLAQPTPEGLREKIKALLENTELRARLGSNAREQIVSNQSLQAIVAKELKLYEEIL